jgi:hypothetical protein
MERRETWILIIQKRSFTCMTMKGMLDVVECCNNKQKELEK